MQILDLIERQQRLSVAEICTSLLSARPPPGVTWKLWPRRASPARAWRGDCAAKAPPEQPILDRQNEQTGDKIRIGQAAAQLVGDGETIFLGGGPRCWKWRAPCAMRRADRNYQFPAGAQHSGWLPDVTVICLGGMLRDSELSFIGHITEQALAEVRADKVIIGTRAISLEYGLTHEYLPETMTDRAILKAGKEIIVLADPSEFRRAATVRLAPLESIHTIITDQGTSQDFLHVFQERRVS